MKTVETYTGSKKVVALASGGLDSSVLMYSLFIDLDCEVIGLGIHYGQSHQKELAAASKVCNALGIPFRFADLSGLGDILSSALTNPKEEIPEGHYEEESMKATVVPNRNMIFLSVAAGVAISKDMGGVAIAAHAGDHAIYPDCRRVFMQKMGNVLSSCHYSPLTLWTPFLHLSKAEIVKKGAELGVPFELTWSCYKGGDKHCGKCGTCVERKEAFVLANVSDPTEYEE